MKKSEQENINVNAAIEISAVMSRVTSVLRDVVKELQELKKAPNRLVSADDCSQRHDARGSRAEQEAGVCYEVGSRYDVRRRAPIDYGYGGMVIIVTRYT
jgi:hypothetical protein